jgi:adenosylcobyric acid synthase
MLQGSSSSVGKSLLTAALCRIFTRRGRHVAPFKAQNMSNNAAVCADGAEIGRAQAIQAAAARIAPTADMNPVLLKPEADARSQVIVLGRPWGTLPARSFQRRKEELGPIVTAALDRLRSAYDLVIIEGAGSPVELNLKSTDIVNMAVARHARSPVLLIGDIDRGGIFAQLLGTLWLLGAEERALVRGFVVNRFRGDRTLFADGVRILEERGEVPVLGVIPYLPAHAIPEEDATALDSLAPTAQLGMLDIAVVHLPRIANFDDFDPLRAEPTVRLHYVRSVAELGRPHAVLVPGTKSTLADLAWLREQGFDVAIQGLARTGTAVVGICGGYQMLGQVIRDPNCVESPLLEMSGLGLLPVTTVFAGAKTTHQVFARLLGGPGWMAALAGQTVTGYEIHMGHTGGNRPWLQIEQRSGQPVGDTDGAAEDTGRIWGCYLHGLFANDSFRHAWLDSLGETGSPPSAGSIRQPSLDEALDQLAQAVEQALDMRRLEEILAAE